MRNKSLILALGLLTLVGGAQLGCRACQNCLDYGSPVVHHEGCACSPGGGYGQNRSGSSLSGEPTPTGVEPTPAPSGSGSASRLNEPTLLR